MREQRNDPKRLKDILQAIDAVFQYVEDRDMEAFVADKKSLTQEGQALVCHVCKMTQDWTTGVECALKCMLRK